MQKNNKKASILLWSIFMSLLLGAIFITASIEIQNTLEENDTFSKISNSNRTFDQALGNNKPDTKYPLGNGELLQMESQKQYEVGLKQIEEGGMKKGEIIEIIYENNSENTNDITNIQIEVLEGSVLYYIKGSENKTFLTTTNVMQIAKGQTLVIENTSGYARVKISASDNLLFPKRCYKVIKQVGPKKILKTSGSIQ